MPLLNFNFPTALLPPDQVSNSSDLSDSLPRLSGRLEQEDTGAFQAYPSPPMSGSPPPSQKALPVAGDVSQRPIGQPPLTSHHDALQHVSGRPDLRPPQGQLPDSESYGRLTRPEAVERMTYGYQQQQGQPEGPPRPLSFPPQALPSLSQAQQPFTPAGGSGSPMGYTMPGRPPPAEQSFATSPKSQRKVKGHVASACVPCKRAHLRCDSQRPCSRCLTNGKEDSCHDVVHKKRGRPRLRDENPRFDMTRPLIHHEGLPRNLSVYSQPGPEFLRYGERSIPGVPDYPRPHASQPDEPVAYLTTNFEFARVSPSFDSSIGGLNHRRLLREVVIPEERQKVSRLHDQLAREQKQREPNYLPPILDRGEHLFTSLGFSAEDVARYQLGPQDHMTFALPNGRPRFLTFRIGLAKEGSIYFVVLALAAEPRVPYPQPPGLHERPPPTGYPPPVQSLPPPFYDPSRRDHSAYPLPHDPSQQARSMMPTSSHGSMPYATPPRQDPVAPHIYPPRSETLLPQPGAPSAYQLPPILAPEDRGVSGRDPVRPQRDERASRVDIGGLIDKPQGSSQPH